MDSIKKIIELVPRVTDANVIRELSYPANKGLLTFERLNKDALELTITRDFSCMKSHTDVIKKKFLINSDNQLHNPESMLEFIKEHGIESLFRGSGIYRTIRQVQALAIVKGQVPAISRALTLLIDMYELPSDADVNQIEYVGIALSCLLGVSLTFKHPGGVEVTIVHKHTTTTSMIKIKQNGKLKFNNQFSLGDTPLIFNKLIPEWDKHVKNAPQLLSDIYYTVVDLKEDVKDDDTLRLLVDAIAKKCHLDKLPGGLQNEHAKKYIRP